MEYTSEFFERADDEYQSYSQGPDEFRLETRGVAAEFNRALFPQSRNVEDLVGQLDGWRSRLDGAYRELRQSATAASREYGRHMWYECHRALCDDSYPANSWRMLSLLSYLRYYRQSIGSVAELYWGHRFSQAISIQHRQPDLRADSRSVGAIRLRQALAMLDSQGISQGGKCPLFGAIAKIIEVQQSAASNDLHGADFVQAHPGAVLDLNRLLLELYATAATWYRALKNPSPTFACEQICSIIVGHIRSHRPRLTSLLSILDSPIAANEEYDPSMVYVLDEAVSRTSSLVGVAESIRDYYMGSGTTRDFNDVVKCRKRIVDQLQVLAALEYYPDRSRGLATLRIRHRLD